MTTRPPIRDPRRRVQWLPALILPLLAWAQAAWHGDLLWDDVYIYARVARNILEGRGFLFNDDGLLDPCTSPLYLVLVVAVSAVTGDILASIRGLHVAIFSSVLWLTWRCLEDRAGRWPAALAVAGVFAHPLTVRLAGGEGLLLVALVLAALLAHERGRDAWLGLALGLVVLARGDGALLVLLIAADRLRQGRLVPGPRALALFATPPLLWAAFHAWRFGTPLPVTLDAKLAQGASGVWMLFGEGLHGFVLAGSTGLDVAVTWLVLAAASLGLVLAVRDRDAAPALFGLFGAAHVAAYVVLRLPFYHWYYATELVAAWILAAYAAGRARRPAATAALAAAVVILASFERVAPPPHAYFEMADDLRGRVPDGSRVLVTELGILGWAMPGVRFEDTVGISGFVRGDEVRSGRFGAWLERPARPDFALVLDRAAAQMLHREAVPRFLEDYVPVLRVLPADPSYVGTLFARRPASAPRVSSVLRLLGEDQLRPPVIQLATEVLDGELVAVLEQHPTTTVRLEAPAGTLRLRYGLRPAVHDKCAGVRFKVLHEGREVLRAEVRPQLRAGDRAWLSGEAHLPAPGTLELTTEAIASDDYCWAAWLSPEITRGRAALTDAQPPARAGRPGTTRG